MKLLKSLFTLAVATFSFSVFAETTNPLVPTKDNVSAIKESATNKVLSVKSSTMEAVQSTQNNAKEKMATAKSEVAAQANTTKKSVVEKANETTATMKNTATKQAEATKSTIKRAGKINVNKADAQTLQNLTGIGEAKAQAIIDYRTKHGKIKNIEELSKVSGIGEVTLSKIKSSISF